MKGLDGEWVAGHLDDGAAAAIPRGGSAAQNLMVTTLPDGRLVIRWFADHEGAALLLFTEERSLVAPERLAELGFTRREAEVLRWLAEGKTDSEIGLILEISPHTAHKHVQNILSKLGVSNRASAVLRLWELSWPA